MMNEFSEAGDRTVVLLCECGRLATGYAAARCGQDRRHNMRVGCPTRAVVIELVGVIPDHGYVQPEMFRSRREEPVS